MQATDDFIKNTRNLPPAPRVVPELMRLLHKPDLDSSKIVNIISYDPSLTANLLRVCNSAYFAPATPTADLQEAITRLGFQQVYKLVAATTGARLLGAAQSGYGLESGDLWKHSIAAAVAAQLVARAASDNENIAFIATLLHDIGKTILSQSLSGAYERIVKETGENGQTLLDAEIKVLGVSHAEVGARLLERWNFPPDLVAAVRHHHAPEKAGAHQRLASCVYVGNMISNFMGHGYGHCAFALHGRAETLSILGLTAESVPDLMLQTIEQTQLIDALFSLAA